MTVKIRIKKEKKISAGIEQNLLFPFTTEAQNVYAVIVHFI